jgi:alkanesulfonate monooxygenase SsuD/methylene tetrahydromethanopterin reductase-like flavin-dependent oxidoreductase (luciferase family)
VDIGVGLPAAIPGASAQQVLHSAKKADNGPFSTVTMIDRLVFDNYEPLVMLAAVAAVTRRVNLMPMALLAPLRNTAWLAKQAATLDPLSGGRLILGLAVGAREDDFTAAEKLLRGRGQAFEKQIRTMKRIWAGEPYGDGAGPIGPNPATPGGPRLMIGGYAPAAINRVRWGDGYLTGRPAAEIRPFFDMAEAVWRDEGRVGKPRFASSVYFTFGEEALERASAYSRSYFAFMGSSAERRVAAVLKTPEDVRNAIQAFADVGTDELTFHPGVLDLDQLDRLADLVE